MDIDIALFSGITLADPHFMEPASIDMILGADVYCQILRQGLKRFPSCSTSLGWVISGSARAVTAWRAESSVPRPLATFHCTTENDFQGLLQRFWEVEEVGSGLNLLRPVDEACEKHFRDTYSRAADGRFTVRLPFTQEPIGAAAETRRMAVGSLNSMERRFTRDPWLEKEYRDFMSQFL